MVKDKEAAQDLLTISVTMDLSYRWSTGKYLGRFYQEIRDNATIYGNVCPKCQLCLVPPRIICPRCYIKMGDWVTLGPGGTVLSYNVTVQSFWDPHTAMMRPVPYTHAYIQLDGSLGGVISHVLEETESEKLKVSMRVKAVFRPKEERVGEITDILYFETIRDKE